MHYLTWLRTGKGLPGVECSPCALPARPRHPLTRGGGRRERGTAGPSPAGHTRANRGTVGSGVFTVRASSPSSASAYARWGKERARDRRTEPRRPHPGKSLHFADTGDATFYVAGSPSSRTRGRGQKIFVISFPERFWTNLGVAVLAPWLE